MKFMKACDCNSLCNSLGGQCLSREMSQIDSVKSLAINQSFLRTAVGASRSRGEKCFARNWQGLQDLGLRSNS